MIFSKISNSIFLVFILLAFSCYSYALPDAYEPDNEPHESSLISIGEIYTGTIDIDYDVDWKKIFFQAANVYIIEVTEISGSYQDMVVELYDSNGILLTYSDDEKGFVGAKISFRAEKSDYYYIKLKTAGIAYGKFDSSRGGVADCTYSITVKELINKSPFLDGSILGPKNITLGETATFSVMADDPEGDELRYDFDWGDGNKTWGKFPEKSHMYESPGSYCIKARVRDIYDGRSPWSTCVTIDVHSANYIEPARADLIYTNKYTQKFKIVSVDATQAGNENVQHIVENPWSGEEKPYLMILNNGTKVLLYTTKLENDLGRSVVYLNLDTGHSTTIYRWSKNAPNTYYNVFYTRGIHMGNGNIIVTFIGVEAISNSEKAAPSNAKIHTFISHDNGQTFKPFGEIKSKLETFPDWSGIWQASPVAIGKNKIGIIAVEQLYRADGICIDTGVKRYHDDLPVFFVKENDEWTIRSRVYKGECGEDFNEPALIILPDDRYLVVLHKSTEGSLYYLTSSDRGRTWDTLKLIVSGTNDIDNRYPVLYENNGNIVLVYRNLHRSKNQLLDKFSTSTFDHSKNTWSEPVQHNSPAGYFAHKLK